MSTEVTLKSQIENPQTSEKFAKLYLQKHPEIKNEDDARLAFESEKFAFLNELTQRQLNDVTPISAAGVFLDAINNNLTFSGTSKYIYLISRNVKNGDTWEKRLQYSVTPYGKLRQAERSGAIKRAGNPTLVYEGDFFSIETDDEGDLKVHYKATIPRLTNKIIAGFITLYFHDGHKEAFWMEMQAVERLKGYSEKQNRRKDDDKGKANALYSSGPDGQIDTGFFEAKLVSHALKNIRKEPIPTDFYIEDAEIIDDLNQPGKTQPSAPQTLKAEIPPEPPKLKIENKKETVEFTEDNLFI